MPKIIDDETFEKVQAMIKNYYNPCKRTSSIDRFNMIYCADCGNKLYFDASGGFYSCRKCHTQVIKGEKLNKALEEDLRNLIITATKDYKK